MAEQESAVSRLEITRETMTEILFGDDAVTEPDGRAETQEPEEPDGPVPVPDTEGFAVGSPVGVRLVPSWSAESGLEVLPQAYAALIFRDSRSLRVNETMNVRPRLGQALGA
ncbi:hypothetical protein [Streptomyces mirabilis]|uniref:hypothetical protein n=1 Tax=Streptomyces mirabilis TaxID=68239 RepID=UPI002258B9D5|nr:hypothetical protein [Streptomyces mirabilis]MCX4419382.1 hypothetical protein [Streptomyces mirabilis]